jgi:hypothetical protein
MPTFSSCSNTAGLSEILLPIMVGIMLIVSVPAAIITSASPRRMRSAASATACTPEEQKRLMVMPGTLLRQPGQQQADAGDVHALLGFRHGAADDDVADQLRVEAGRARHDVADDVGQHVVGAHVLQRAADLADRGARGGDDVGVLYLFAHLGSP